jgi:starvation-inducible outer membrane lipoprotein
MINNREVDEMFPAADKRGLYMWDLLDQFEAQDEWFNRYDYWNEAGYGDPYMQPPYIHGVTVITVVDRIQPIFVSVSGIEEIPF